MKKEWTQKEIEYLKLEIPKNGTKLCAENLGRSISSTQNKANQLNLRWIRTYQEPIEKSRIKTPKFAYLLGLIWADGCVHKERHCITTNLKIEDAFEFQSIFEHSGKWRVMDYKNKLSSGLTRRFQVMDKSFYELLVSLDYLTKSKSSMEKCCGFLGKELFRYFICGFFDGDGHVTKSKFRLGFSGRVDYDWRFLINYFKEQGVEPLTVSIVKTQKGGTSHIFTENRLAILRFYKLFVFEEIGLTRKKNCLKSFVNKLSNKYLTPRKIKTKNGIYYPIVKLNSKNIYLGKAESLEEAERKIQEFDKKYKTKRFLITNEIKEIKTRVANYDDSCFKR